VESPAAVRSLPDDVCPRYPTEKRGALAHSAVKYFPEKSKGRLLAALDSRTGANLFLVALPIEQFADG
jgi:hypothetical protein